MRQYQIKLGIISKPTNFPIWTKARKTLQENHPPRKMKLKDTYTYIYILKRERERETLLVINHESSPAPAGNSNNNPHTNTGYLQYPSLRTAASNPKPSHRCRRGHLIVPDLSVESRSRGTSAFPVGASVPIPPGLLHFLSG
ncbi:hypothetical protein I7I50_12149 [Histoplasma capsulatum G186AR]|uniref:Uncharacterized protein n=1 Tax=Ajellomyces capsulatus TaxID=5037 RepID=A0A8H8CS49_AJECA|nr:hypothetical protein I7I52_11540 [Histoplasma capsulatum]QSS70498.1 hypothetical protein I7I50_12149 [Histoplasma capsulatum G186AR]